MVWPGSPSSLLARCRSRAFWPSPGTGADGLSQRKLSLREGFQHLKRMVLSCGWPRPSCSTASPTRYPASLFIYFVGQRLRCAGQQGPLLFTLFPLRHRRRAARGCHRQTPRQAPRLVLRDDSRLRRSFRWPASWARRCLRLHNRLHRHRPAARLRSDPSARHPGRCHRQRHRLLGRAALGLYFAAWSFITKLAVALSAGVVFPLLDLAGFIGDQTATQTPEL